MWNSKARATRQFQPRAGLSGARAFARARSFAAVQTRLLALSLLLTLLYGCSFGSKAPPPGPPVSGLSVCKIALGTVGAKYAYGGNSPKKGFDCSGLVCWAYGQNGISMPRTADEQSDVGSKVNKKGLRPGDLVVFRISGGYHTGIYTGKGKFVHSPSRGKRVRVDDLNSEYWSDKFVSGRRHGRLY